MNVQSTCTGAGLLYPETSNLELTERAAEWRQSYVVVVQLESMLATSLARPSAFKRPFDQNTHFSGADFSDASETRSSMVEVCKYDSKQRDVTTM